MVRFTKGEVAMLALYHRPLHRAPSAPNPSLKTYGATLCNKCNVLQPSRLPISTRPYADTSTRHTFASHPPVQPPSGLRYQLATTNFPNPFLPPFPKLQSFSSDKT